MPTLSSKNNNKEHIFSGKRVKRGLYKSKNGTLLNADVNGAANILRKVFPKVTRWDSGIVDIPFVANVFQKVVFNDFLKNICNKETPTSNSLLLSGG